MNGHHGENELDSAEQDKRAVDKSQ